jgi:cytochrome c-type biogenesis protein CcmF
MLSRDSFIVLGTVTLLVIATVIGLATSMPVISSIPLVGHGLQDVFATFFTIDDGTYYNQSGTPFTDGRFGLVGSFYSATVPPLGLILLGLMIIGPLLGWRDSSARQLLRTLAIPAIFAVLATCGTLLLVLLNGEAVQPIGLGYVGLGAFALGTNLVMIVRTMRGGWFKIGGYLAHIGLAVMLAGAVASSLYATPEQKLVISQNDRLTAYGYTFLFNGWRTTPDGKGLLDITVYPNGSNDPWSATPLLYFNPRMGATVATPSIKTEPWQDLYITPVEYLPANDQNTAQFGVQDVREVGPYKLTFLGFRAMDQSTQGSADVGARVKLEFEGQTYDLMPGLRVVANETDPLRAFQPLPAELPDGRQLMLENFDPLQRKVQLRVMGLSLPVDPAKAVVNVSIKPGVQLVWLGAIIGVLGGLLAVVRRTVEGRRARATAPVSQPMPGLAGD